jgi:hypothetical protein
MTRVRIVCFSVFAQRHRRCGGGETTARRRGATHSDPERCAHLGDEVSATHLVFHQRDIRTASEVGRVPRQRAATSPRVLTPPATPSPFPVQASAVQRLSPSL